MRQETAAIVGFLVAPVLPALVLGALTPVTTREVPDLTSAIVLFPIAYVFSVVFTGLFGAPAFFLGRRLRLIRWWSSSIVGFAIGAAAAFIVGYPAPTAFTTVMIYALLGAASGLIFWTIWEQRRPQSET